MSHDQKLSCSTFCTTVTSFPRRNFWHERPAKQWVSTLHTKSILFLDEDSLRRPRLLLSLSFDPVMLKMFNYISFCFYYGLYRVIKLIMWIAITSLPTALVEDLVCKLFARNWKIKISNGDSMKGKGLYDEKLLTQEIVVHNSKFYKAICIDQLFALGVSCLRN